MPLEDHVGEILRKARLARSISVQQAAQWASLTAAQWESIEAKGALAPSIDLEKIAQHLQLHPAKLQAVATGWSPAPVDLAQWREIRQITTSQNDLHVHAYLVWDEVSREAALFDTGWDAEPLLKLIREETLQLQHVFLTHTHDDHMNGLASVRAHFPKIFLHTNSQNAPPKHRNRPNDFIHLGSLRITNRETPGHAEDGVCYMVGNWPDDAPHVAFVGDTLFAGSVATGHQSHDLLCAKIREQLLSLSATTLLCPGHGPLTTVQEEKEHNPFF